MINYTITEFPVQAYSFQAWSSQDLGSLSQTLWNGMTEYNYVTDGYPDGGNLPLKLIISPADVTQYTVSASQFTISNKPPTEIIYSNNNVNNGFRYLKDSFNDLYYQDISGYAEIDRVEFWDTTTPGTVGNQVIVYA